MSEFTADTGEVLRVAELAKYLKLSEAQVRRITKAGEIPYAKIRGSYRYILSEIRAWLKQISITPDSSGSGSVGSVSDGIWDPSPKR